ncbi:DUF779 domain-containing protein [Nitrosospira briensis]|uniref:DUF779 domain-containing protein n=1 Tax=Nitrosospira briensis TaxID=35799 RepID=UPI0009F1A8CE
MVMSEHGCHLNSNIIRCVDVTPEAAEWIHKLEAAHGPLLFFQSGGCCDGSSPMCYIRKARSSRSEIPTFFLTRLRAGHLYQWFPVRVLASTGLLIDVMQGRGSSFSLEAPEGIRF